MNKKLLTGLLLIVVLAGTWLILSGVQEEEKEDVVESETVGENAWILTTKDEFEGMEYTGEDITYIREGRAYRNYFNPKLRQALDWIKENTEEDSTFLCWWDYGHMIRGYSSREVIIYAPSEDILYTLSSKRWDEEASGDFTPREKIDDVVSALISQDPTKTREVMERYNAGYVFAATEDEAKIYVFSLIAGYDPIEYQVEGEPTGKAKETIIFRMINEETIEGLELVYADEYVKIYWLISHL